MGNTLATKLPEISNRIYEELFAKAVLVPSCDRSYEGEFDMDKREIDIPVYHDLSIHKTTIKEAELKPAPAERIKSSTIRVSIDKMRYTHWEKLNIEKMVDDLLKQDSVVRQRLVNKWAEDAEEELFAAIYGLSASRTLDMGSLLSQGYVDKTNITQMFEILKAKVKAKKLTPADFKLFASEKLESVAAEAQLTFGSLPAEDAFKNGFVGLINKVDVRKHETETVIKRNASTGIVEAEFAVWKTRDGIQYVIPYKETSSYDLYEGDHLFGGKGFKTVQFYDFFNIYPDKLWKVKIPYKSGATYPTMTAAKFGTVK